MKRLIQILNWSRPKAVSVLTLVLCVSAHGQSWFAYPPSGTIFTQTRVVSIDTFATDTSYFAIPTNAGKFLWEAGATHPDSLTRLDNLYQILQFVEFEITRLDTNYADSVSAEIVPLDQYFSVLPGGATYTGADSLGNGERHRLIITDSLGVDIPYGFRTRITSGDTLIFPTYRIRTFLTY